MNSYLKIQEIERLELICIFQQKTFVLLLWILLIIFTRLSTFDENQNEIVHSDGKSCVGAFVSIISWVSESIHLFLVHPLQNRLQVEVLDY